MILLTSHQSRRYIFVSLPSVPTFSHFVINLPSFCYLESLFYIISFVHVVYIAALMAFSMMWATSGGIKITFRLRHNHSRTLPLSNFQNLNEKFSHFRYKQDPKMNLKS